MSAILVTGATTPLGVGVVRALLEDPAVRHVLAVGAEPAPPPELPASSRLSYLRADLTRSREVRGLLFAPAHEHGVTRIIHTALHRSAAAEGRKVRALNVESTRELLALSEDHPTIRHFLFCSSAEVYKVRADQPSILDEDHPLDLSPGAPQWKRDRVEADLIVCARMGLSSLRVMVLRCAECLAADTGSQLYDYLQSAVCFSALGYDPMLNLLSFDDAVRAIALSARHDGQGVFNIPGADTLPLSAVIAGWGRTGIPVPALLLHPLYRLRALTIGTQFRYDLNRWRFHFSGVLDGRRASEQLGYVPARPIAWPGGDRATRLH
jgi:UDP-glucose 4-epimerase